MSGLPALTSNSSVVSEARIGRNSRKVIAGVVGVACLLIIATAIPSGVLLITTALAMALLLPNRIWIVSTPEPEATATAVLAHAGKLRDG